MSSEEIDLLARLIAEEGHLRDVNPLRRVLLREIERERAIAFEARDAAAHKVIMKAAWVGQLEASDFTPGHARELQTLLDQWEKCECAAIEALNRKVP